MVLKERVYDKKIQDAAKILEIENLLQRKPKALSGGQRQRSVRTSNSERRTNF